MAFSDTVVSLINESLKAGSLNNKKFQPGAYHGITTLVARNKGDGSLQLMPGIADNNGEYKTVEPNDKFNLVVYHKSIGNNYSYQRQASFGDNMQIKSVNDMAMIVWADNKKTQLNPEQIEAIVMAGFPQRLSETKRKEMKITSCLISPVSTDMDKLRVFRQEYQNFDFFLRPQHSFFQLRYRIELVFNQQCLDACGCG